MFARRWQVRREGIYDTAQRRERLLCNDSRHWKGIALTQYKYASRMGNVAPHIATKYQVGQDAFDLVKINGHPKPLEGMRNLTQSNLMLIKDKMYPFEKIAIANCLALF